MIFVVDYDGTLIEQDTPYDDVTTSPKLKPYAREALAALKAAGHLLILSSGRSSRALLEDPELDPLVRAGVRKVDRGAWEKSRPLNEARYRQMLEHVRTELPHVFDAVDDGQCGKLSADVFIDDRALRFGERGLRSGAWSWADVAEVYGLELADGDPGPG